MQYLRLYTVECCDDESRLENGRDETDFCPAYAAILISAQTD
jgi:hypothetical protein